jgi:hypothetical protein
MKPHSRIAKGPKEWRIVRREKEQESFAKKKMVSICILKMLRL